MFKRGSSARKSPKTASLGRPQLTLAKVILLVEATLRYFARPLFFAGLFLGLSWLGIFTQLYPWAHLVALALFIILFFDALGRSKVLWSRPSLSLAMRRVEEASGLRHRPMDVVDDRPIGINDETHTLWQEHVLRARMDMRKLRWPAWKMDWAKHDPHNLRYGLMVLLVVGGIFGWGALGGRIIEAINPALGRIPVSTATIDAWITPPEYTHMAPIMIATPAGSRYQDQVIKIPEGSVLHAYLAERDGDTPVLEANNQKIDFNAQAEKDFGVTTTLKTGDTIAIHRGWMTLETWKVQIVADTAPQVSFTDLPSASEHKAVRVAYDAKDDYGVTSVTLRVTPRQALFGIDAKTLELPLANLDEKDVKRVDFKDLTDQPWAGTLVDLQLIATDAVGHKSESDRVAYTLPEREFFQPVARMLIEERKKLLNNLLSVPVRSEVANLMAGLAHQPTAFGSDPVVMMSLRAGAVRLVLDRDADAALSAKDILWQTAVRIEDGVMGLAEQNLKQAQQDLAEALDHNASEKDVQKLIDRLHQALAQYLAQLSTRMASQPQIPEDLKQIMGPRTNFLSPKDLEKMLNNMRNLSANGARDEARQMLSQLNEMLQNLSTHAPQLSKDQKEALENLKNLQAMTKEQQELMDKTYQDSQKDNSQDDQKEQKSDSSKDQKSTSQKSAKSGQQLAGQQHDLKSKLQTLMNKLKSNTSLSQSADAMARAEADLKQGGLQAAVPSQNEALKALRQAQQSMAESMQQGSSGIPLPGSEGASGDPFGREDGKSMTGDTNKMHVPDRFEAQHVREILDEIQHRAGDLTRPKTERDYIERLLQNF